MSASRPAPRGRAGSSAPWTALLVAGTVLCPPAPASAQSGEFRLQAPSGLELEFERDSLMRMLERTRTFYDTLVQDPDVLYYTGHGDPVPDSAPAGAYPWNSVEVLSDSVARVFTPSNVREGDRAFYNYAVARMRAVRSADDADGGGEPGCGARMDREARLLSAFADGWIVARLLYGAPPFTPLDEIAFVRERGMTRAYLAVQEPLQLGECAGRWRREHRKAVEAYREWRRLSFLGPK